MAASHSTEPPPPDPGRPAEGRLESVAAAFGALGGAERLAALGAVVCLASLPLPWYRVELDRDLVRTGLGAFGFAEAALLLTLGAALFLLFLVGRGRRPPLPLHEGTLLAAAGFWSGLLVFYLVLDRPNFRFKGFESDYDLAYGIFVALGGATLLALAGLRIRRDELARERVGPPESAR